MTKALLVLILLVTPLYGVDRYISPAASSMNPCTFLQPCPYAKALSIRLPGDRLVAHGGIYELGLPVDIILFGDGPVSVITPIWARFPLEKATLLAPPPSLADVVVRLRGRLTAVRWNYRKTDISTVMYCTVNKSTKVEEIK